MFYSHRANVDFKMTSKEDRDFLLTLVQDDKLGMFCSLAITIFRKNGDFEFRTDKNGEYGDEVKKIINVVSSQNDDIKSIQGYILDSATKQDEVLQNVKDLTSILQNLNIENLMKMAEMIQGTEVQTEMAVTKESTDIDEFTFDLNDLADTEIIPVEDDDMSLEEIKALQKRMGGS